MRKDLLNHVTREFLNVLRTLPEQNQDQQFPYLLGNCADVVMVPWFNAPAMLIRMNANEYHVFNAHFNKRGDQYTIHKSLRAATKALLEVDDDRT